MKVRLVVVQGRPEGMEIPLPMPQFLIGRDPRCNLRPSSESVSKLHCAILQRASGVYIRDLKSTNGTFVNNDRIQGETRVQDGDLVRVGPLVLAVKIQADAILPSQGQPSNAEDQAVSWLLDYSPSPERDDLGGKTTIMDMSGLNRPNDTRRTAIESDTKAEVPTAKPPLPPAPPSKGRTATAEVASDLLEKMLAPPKKKKS